MRKSCFTLLFLLTAFCSSFAQSQRHVPVDKEPFFVVDILPATELKRQLRHDQPGSSVLTPSTDLVAPAQKGAATALNVQAIGTASNAYSILRPEQNQVIADNPSEHVVFIHRQNTAIWGGQNGELRYDYSTDGGQTWPANQIDIGPLNPLFSRPARYPQVAHYTETTGKKQLVYYAPTLDPQPAWDGHVYGLEREVATANPTEHYGFLLQNTLLPGGLCEGKPNEFWTVDFAYDGNDIMDSLFLYKGATANNDVSFSRVHTYSPAWNSASTGGKIGIGPNVTFSPDGNIGWVVAVGDIVGGRDSILHPIVSKTTDGGATWSSLTEVYLDHVDWLDDTLQSFWTQLDFQGQPMPVSSGKYTLTGDFDVITDINGNLHIINVLASASTLDTNYNEIPGEYVLFPGLAKMVVDIFTPDGGATWDVRYIAPALAWRGTFGGGSQPITMENFCQIARDEAGERIFYSWVDQDSSVAGLFGESTLIAPNLRISSCRVTDGYQTCWHRITDGDLVWDGRVLAPTLSPIVVQRGGDYHFPIVMLDMPANDPLQPVQFHYIGEDAVLGSGQYFPQGTIDLSFLGTCPLLPGIADPDASLFAIGSVFPNPFSASLAVTLELGQAAEVTLRVYDLQGRQLALPVEGRFAAGNHTVGYDGKDAAGQALPSGMYILRMEATADDGQVYAASKRIVHTQ